MDLANVKASDWEIACIAQLGGAKTAGAGVFWFDLRSRSKKIRDVFTLSAAGVGAGGSLGGASGPGRNMQPSYTKIPCKKEFSIRDLDQSLGRITQASVALSIGYSLTYISATTLDGDLFTSVDVSGISIGVALGAFCFAGMWRSNMLALRSINEANRRRAIGLGV